MRVPPSLTNSATTPSSRWLTSSMKAGGKDHSRPTSRPTFSVIRQLHSRSIVTADIHADHLLPKRPVVNPAIPYAQSMPDAFAPQYAGEALVVRALRSASSNSNDH